MGKRFFTNSQWREHFKLPVQQKKFQAFLLFVEKNFQKHEPITAQMLVSDPRCPVRDKKTVAKYLQTIQRREQQYLRSNLHQKDKRLLDLKSIYAHGKIFFRGCTQQQANVIKRVGFVGWIGLQTSAFFERHPLLGSILLERIYRFHEYGEPLLPNLARLLRTRNQEPL